MTWSTPSAAIAITSGPAAGVQGSPDLVVGSVLIISGLATQLRPEEGLVLGPGYVTLGRADERSWSSGAIAAQQRRFRRDPAAYLAKLEQQCLQLLLPS